MKITELSEEKYSPTKNLFLTPGTRSQIIGAQNGGFPAFGHHVENEMGGVWSHPIKLLDGFWMGIKVDNQRFEWLKEATLFKNYAFYNEHIYEKPEIKITRMQFAPENLPGIIVKYTFENTSNESKSISGKLVARSDLRPVWFADEMGILPGKDQARSYGGNGVIIEDSRHSWFAYLGVEGVKTRINVGQIHAYEETFGDGVSGEWSFDLTLETGESQVLFFKVAGSTSSQRDVVSTMNQMNDAETLFEEKSARYQEILESAEIDVPDKELMKQHGWVKCHMEWLTTHVPGIGSGLTAGSPEYPWWFGCDSAYALAGCFPVGFHQLAEDTLDTIAKFSIQHNGNGRIIHEVNTYGHVYNPGNTQETAHFIYCLYELYKWTGNKDWLEKHYDLIKEGLRWLLEEMDEDGDLFPEGYGIMEVNGLNGELIDTAVFTAMALKHASKIAKIFGDNELSAKYMALGQELEGKIITEMWLEEEGMFGDIRIPGKLLYSRLDDFICQASKGSNKHIVPYYEKMKEMLKQNGWTDSNVDTPWCFKNWVVNLPIEMKIASKEQAFRSLKRLNSDEFVGDYGMYVSGLEQTRMMTISTASLINANLSYGLADEAYVQMKNIMKTFNMYLSGSISEMSPSNGCFVQAWTSYGVLRPVITGFLGIEPDAGRYEVTIKPQLPKDWDYATVKNLKVGANEIDVFVNRIESERYHVKVVSKENNWTFHGADEVS